MHYLIHNTTSGLNLGIIEADTPDAAWAALCRDAGYAEVPAREADVTIDELPGVPEVHSLHGITHRGFRGALTLCTHCGTDQMIRALLGVDYYGVDRGQRYIGLGGCAVESLTLRVTRG